MATSIKVSFSHRDSEGRPPANGLPTLPARKPEFSLRASLPSPASPGDIRASWDHVIFLAHSVSF